MSNFTPSSMDRTLRLPIPRHPPPLVNLTATRAEDVESRNYEKWDVHSIDVLLEWIGSPAHYSQLKNAGRNNKVNGGDKNALPKMRLIKCIVEYLQSRGISKTNIQVKNKIKHLEDTYKKANDIIVKLGMNNSAVMKDPKVKAQVLSACPFWERLQAGMSEEPAVVVPQTSEAQLDLLRPQVPSEPVDSKPVVLDDSTTHVEKGGDDEEVDFRSGSPVEKGGNTEEADSRSGNHTDSGEKVERSEDCVRSSGPSPSTPVPSTPGSTVTNRGSIMDNIHGKSEPTGGEPARESPASITPGLHSNKMSKQSGSAGAASRRAGAGGGAIGHIEEQQRCNPWSQSGENQTVSKSLEFHRRVGEKKLHLQADWQNKQFEIQTKHLEIQSKQLDVEIKKLDLQREEMLLRRKEAESRQLQLQLQIEQIKASNRKRRRESDVHVQEDSG
ncbi:uncharacterized protein [Physcomitrium patens]|uniref:Myb/SANT-like DNA-binding domain-containing protein n=1 Tax=Physcomitrium patens TaxID=3218 RepID=A0A2K1LAU9_PHYPA|nr:uncharacterized protein LOC112289935 [Physcomitrium patens]XP_024391465.1 uncharacterized protein LOC112289935 [Physcomitrium patens]XP_024391474.1 uncharacterized protein LOC112289935 [Physcomitrium patens]XP_024391482.1 uncharacterized protein LOC112289935 [Physcomitrium patens]XP_024391490.1 uncharacterized protein LOC112289935 [Physcomitrium patens]PNR63164.1 hypothetical protein PHYPA_001589 [Physcomitrium patens]|eukprot:XP_024391460.1 uncharacterized protein LOC112289935 [Physcomitrella patens]